MTTEARNLIESYVNKKIDNYYKLPIVDKFDVVAATLKDLSKYDLQSILSDADQDSVLPSLFINVLENHASQESVNKFLEGFFKVFVHGTAKNHPYFYNSISTDFSEEWQEQWAIRNEHFENDAMNRAREARQGQRC